LNDERHNTPRHTQYSVADRIGKYLIHGFVLSVLMLSADIVLAVMLPMLVIFASYLGLLIWFGLVMLAWGWINGILCGWLWRFRVNQHWTSLIGHGFVIYLVLLIVGLPIAALLQLALGDISQGIFIPIQLASLSIIDGIIGEAIGRRFKESYVPPQQRVVVPWRTPTD
jgi:hypothetical protein